MTILTNVLGLCSICLFLHHSAFCQKKTKCSELFDVTIHSYTTDSCHARGIKIIANSVFTANSNGSVWEFDLQTQKSQVWRLNEVTGELRDIDHVGDTLILMQSGNGLIVNLCKKGMQRTVQSSNFSWDSVFMDGVDFYGTNGFLMGDPIDGKFSLFNTTDGGTSWNKCLGDIFSYEGEAGFAASGSNLQVLNDSTFVFVSGGNKSRFFKTTDQGKTWESYSIPFPSNPTSGAYSLLMLNELNGIVVGGDYTQPNERKNTCFLTSDGGKTWKSSKKNPFGYRSCIQALGDLLFCCGTNGIDYSFNNGKTWNPLNDWNSFAMATSGNKLVVTLPLGKIAEIRLKKNQKGNT